MAFTLDNLLGDNNDNDDDHNNNHQQHKLAGLIGLGLTIPLFLLTSWRLAFHFTHGEASPTQFWTLRRRFHLLLWSATVMELLAYADFAGLLGIRSHSGLGTNLSDKLAYICLDLLGRSTFEYLAFSAVTELWLQTAFQSSPSISRHFQGSLVVRSLNRILGFVSVLLSGILALFLLVDSDSLAQIENTELLFRLQILMEALCWAGAAAFCSTCIKITSERIQTSFATFPPNDALESVALQCQALVPMGVCAICYSVRSLFLLCRLAGATPLFATTTTTIRFLPVWWVAFVWAPTLLVVVCALYSARRRDRSVMDTDENHVPLLGTPTPPPAEAFENFRLFADGVSGIQSPFSTPIKQQQQQQSATNSNPSSSSSNTDANNVAGNSNLGEYNVV